MLRNQPGHSCCVPGETLEARASKRRGKALPERTQAAISVAGLVKVPSIGRLGKRDKPFLPAPPCAGGG
jgi:hypothetical protein